MSTTPGREDGILHTPELTSCLDGITRATIFTLAQELGYTIREKRITRDEVYICDEAFFTGTAAEVVPIRSLDGRTIGSGSRGPVTEKLQNIENITWFRVECENFPRAGHLLACGASFSPSCRRSTATVLPSTPWGR